MLTVAALPDWIVVAPVIVTVPAEPEFNVAFPVLETVVNAPVLGVVPPIAPAAGIDVNDGLAATPTVTPEAPPSVRTVFEPWTSVLNARLDAVLFAES
jgi:hypothetical protein